MIQAEKQTILPEFIEPEVETVDDDPLDQLRQSMAVVIVLASGLLGLLANLLFYDVPPGINIVAFVVSLCSVAFCLLVFFERPLSWKNLAFALPAILFAIMLSIRTSPLLYSSNLLFVLGSLFIMTFYASHKRLFGGGLFQPVGWALFVGLLGWFEAPMTLLGYSVGWLGRVKLTDSHLGTLSKVIRGLTLALPIVVVFALLLSSADLVFAEIVDNAVQWLIPHDLFYLARRLTLVGIFAWFVMTLFKPMLFNPVPEVAEETGKKRKWLRLSMIETTMIFGSVNLLFVAFVVVQGHYLFGGQANISVQGFTYSEYARRGFEELLMVSFMTMMLILVLDAHTHRKPESAFLFYVLSIGLVVLTGMLMVAANHRLNLYEEAYGFTHIRLMSRVFMYWLPVLFAVLVKDILWSQTKVFWIGCILVAMGYMMTLNLINLDAFIASHNIDRYQETGKLDVYYLTTLSDDAIPEIVTLIDQPGLSPDARENLLGYLGERLYCLDIEREERGLIGKHFGVDRIWKVLDARRDVLLPYTTEPPYWGCTTGLMSMVF